ncbi:somatoliberin [Ochotona princeps]|uniref:somatoliberin n=1 Tax=Ochotona princeps TaxID=9978 RepID=UPI00017790A0|nr:somatoliberin [Ochotona princeps]
MPLWVLFLVLLSLSSSCSHCSPSPSEASRTQRSSDAIFTNNYRKLLRQLSARQLLLDIMSQKQRNENQEQVEKAQLGHKVGSVCTNQKLTTPSNSLLALLQKHSRNFQG